MSLSAAQHGAVATVDPIATDAAIASMKKGGNAIDGAVAAGLTLGVVNGYNSGIGGGTMSNGTADSNRYDVSQDND